MHADHCGLLLECTGWRTDADRADHGSLLGIRPRNVAKYRIRDDDFCEACNGSPRTRLLPPYLFRRLGLACSLRPRRPMSLFRRIHFRHLEVHFLLHLVVLVVLVEELLVGRLSVDQTRPTCGSPEASLASCTR